MAELSRQSCSHRWGHATAGYSLLACLDCEVAWPGEPLPKSPNSYEGFALPDGFVRWHKRVDQMVAELHGASPRAAA